MLEHYTGCLLGLAVGDALGIATEFLSAAEIRNRYGPAGLTDFQSYHGHPPGTFTDDTQMTIALAEGLLAAPGVDLDSLMTSVAEWFVAWAFGPENNRAPGNTCMAACSRLRHGAGWRESGIVDSKGCGAPMRAAPIGLLYRGDLERIVEVGVASSLVTHGHPCAQAGAAAIALAVSLALDNPEPEKILDTVIELTAPISAEFADHLALVPGVLDEEPDDAFAVLGEAWVSEEAVADAFYCFLRSPNDYRRTVLCGANANGDSDSIACMAGAISGAYLGEEAIPADWRRRVEKATYLRDLATRLWDWSGGR